MSSSSRSHHATGTKTAKEHPHGVQELEKMLVDSPSAERVCAKLAQILHVHRNEVALLRVEKGSLRFVFPSELRAAGVIPMTSSAVAARTAATGTPLLSNTFSRVKHASLFESVKLGAGEGEHVAEQPPIQKIMSVPIQASGKVLGVIQISRKGLDASLAGSDFTGEDLSQLERAAEILGRMPFMEEGAPLSEAGT